MEDSINDEFQKEFPSFDIDKADKETIDSEECFNYIFGFNNYTKINEIAQKAREKAIDFGCEPKFNKKYKIRRDKYIKEVRSKGSFETEFNFEEDKNFRGCI